MAESAVNSNGKRPAESSQSVESFAVCTSCSRLSTNLRHCDKCGAALSEDNAALCYSAEPKRARQETDTPATPTGQSSNHLSNGIPSPGTNAVSSGTTQSGSTTSVAMNQSNGNHSDRPVPQDLFLNMGSQPFRVTGVAVSSAPTATTPASSSGDLGPLPQALYVNVNNQVYPVGAPSTSQGTASAQSNQTPSAATTNVSSSTVLTNLSTGTTTSQTPAGLGIVSSPVIAASAVNNTADNTPAPPPYSSSPSTNTGTSSPQLEVKVCLVANQIRIGTKKFIPATTVTFKSEGVLFSLKDYSNAPVLLNARAIVHCRANMRVPFPAFYFLLESSCVKQIQNIFKLPNHVFSDNRNAVDRMRYISIFPNAVSSTDAKGIQQVFKMMQQRFGRPTNILEEIGPDAVLDFLYSDSNPSTTQTADFNRPTNSMVATTSLQMPAISTQPSNPPLPSLGQHRPAILPTASQNILGGGVVTSTNLNLARAGLATSVTINQPQQRPAPTVHQPAGGFIGAPGGLQSVMGGPSQSSPPTLVIPSDSAKWMAMQKSLVAGGVYQVQFQSNQQKRYCLWDGKRFVPLLLEDEVKIRAIGEYFDVILQQHSVRVLQEDEVKIRSIGLVQDTGVQLTCSHVRIGHMKLVSGGPVNIKTEGPQAGISFQFKNSPQNVYSGMKTISIPLNFIASCEVCFDRVPSLYIYPTSQYVDYIRQQCGLRRHEYNPESNDDRDRHIILFLKDVNQDQRKALMSMKRGNMNFVKEMQTLVCLRILSKIKENTSLIQTRIADYGNRPSQNAIDVSSSTARNGAAVARAVIDDDDDDVIMTSEEIGIKCPYTQQVMKEPVRNKHCGHNYEKAAIMEFIRRRAGKGNAKCPYAGCGNQVPLSMLDLEDNWALRDHIRKTTGQT